MNLHNTPSHQEQIIEHFQMLEDWFAYMEELYKDSDLNNHDKTIY